MFPICFEKIIVFFSSFFSVLHSIYSYIYCPSTANFYFFCFHSHKGSYTYILFFAVLLLSVSYVVRVHGGRNCFVVVVVVFIPLSLLCCTMERVVFVLSFRFLLLLLLKREFLMIILFVIFFILSYFFVVPLFC